MGASAERKNKKRSKYLAGLAQSNPEKFHEEWEKRMDSWLSEIESRADKIMEKPERKTPPAFAIVDEVKSILRDITEKGLKKEIADIRDSIDILSGECCNAISVKIDRKMYSLNLLLRQV